MMAVIRDPDVAQPDPLPSPSRESSNGKPKRCSSKTWRNSVAIGSGASSATILKPALDGVRPHRPAQQVDGLRHLLLDLGGPLVGRTAPGGREGPPLPEHPRGRRAGPGQQPEQQAGRRGDPETVRKKVWKLQEEPRLAKDWAMSRKVREPGAGLLQPGDSRRPPDEALVSAEKAAR